MDANQLEGKDYSTVKSQHSHVNNSRALSPRNEQNLQYINMMILKRQKKERYF